MWWLGPWRYILGRIKYNLGQPAQRETSRFSRLPLRPCYLRKIHCQNRWARAQGCGDVHIRLFQSRTQLNPYLIGQTLFLAREIPHQNSLMRYFFHSEFSPFGVQRLIRTHVVVNQRNSLRKFCLGAEEPLQSTLQFVIESVTEKLLGKQRREGYTNVVGCAKISNEWRYYSDVEYVDVEFRVRYYSTSTG